MSVFGTPVFAVHSGGSPNSVTFNTAKGDLIVVIVCTLQTGAVSVGDTIGNSYTVLARSPNSSFGSYTFTCYTFSTGANASNIVTVTQASGAQVIGAWDVPITGAAAFDVNPTNSGGGTTPVTLTYSTAANDEISFGGTATQNSTTQTAGTGYTLDNANTNFGGCFAAFEHQLFTLIQSSVTTGFGTTSGGDFGLSMPCFKALPTFTVSGALGALGAGATVSYSGQASGSVIADGSGNYSIPNLVNGSYTITPSKTGFRFSPTSSNQTVNNANIPNVNFVTTAFVPSGDIGPGFDFRYRM